MFDRKDPKFKISIIGDSGVGKTCFIFRYTDDIFTDNHLKNLDLLFKMKIVKVNETIKLLIWDLPS